MKNEQLNETLMEIKETIGEMKGDMKALNEKIGDQSEKINTLNDVVNEKIVTLCIEAEKGKEFRQNFMGGVKLLGVFSLALTVIGIIAYFYRI